ncbi:MAG: enoyl-CoA hydratase-related protein [Bacillota bacterium]|nr:enoyl-CoA hydratase-related protein [Bacillota bacterium]
MTEFKITEDSVENIQVKVQERIATVTLEATPANALSDEVLDQLDETFVRIEGMELSAVILTGGVERFFCAGANIKGFLSRNALENQAYFERVYQVLQRVQNCKHPVIAAINGYAMGAGLELALCADIRVADERARFGATGVNLGLVFCTQRLPRLVGEGRARELLFTGRVVEAVEAEKIGLVQTLAPEGKALMKAQEIAQTISQKASPAVHGVKQVMNEGGEYALDKALEIEAKQLYQMFDTEAFHTRIENFLKKH